MCARSKVLGQVEIEKGIFSVKRQESRKLGSSVARQSSTIHSVLLHQVAKCSVLRNFFNVLCWSTITCLRRSPGPLTVCNNYI